MANPVALSPELLRLIVCPACRAMFETPSDPAAAVVLRCTGCGNTYPIVDGIPILIIDRASSKDPS